MNDMTNYDVAGSGFADYILYLRCPVR